MMRKLTTAVAFTAGVNLACSPAFPQNTADICRPLLAGGIHDLYNVMHVGHTIKQAKSLICGSRYETYTIGKSSSTDIGITVPDYLDATFGGKTDESNYKERRDQFCNLDESGYNSSTAGYINTRTANVELAQAYNTCVDKVASRYAYVVPSSDLRSFHVNIIKKNGTLEITSFSAYPDDIECSNGLLEASQEDPVEVIGSAQFICRRGSSDDNIVLSGQTSGDGALFENSIELPGYQEGLGNILKRLNAIESSITPPGQVGYFSAVSCPVGWEDIPRNWEGRYFVTTVMDADPRVVVGNALEHGENRATGEHTHKTNSAAFTGGDCILANGCAAWGGDRSISRNVLSTGGPIIDGISAPLKSGTNAPYVTLLACVKL